jgi:hypothetical protein
MTTHVSDALLLTVSDPCERARRSRVSQNILYPEAQPSDSLSQSQSHFTTGGLPPISSSWRQAP